MEHDNLVGTKWCQNGVFFQVCYCGHGSWYALVNTQSGIVEDDLFFEDFNDLVTELTSNNWIQYVPLESRVKDFGG